MKLFLGVIDIPYANAPKRLASKKVLAGEQTTGDVADWLEKKYQVMGRFYELHESDIIALFEESAANAIDDLLLGAPTGALLPFGSALSEIELKFRNYLDHEEITQTGVSGVPTQAALDGINPRLKKGRGAPRPSFIATGLYQASFKAWTE